MSNRRCIIICIVFGFAPIVFGFAPIHLGFAPICATINFIILAVGISEYRQTNSVLSSILMQLYDDIVL